MQRRGIGGRIETETTKFAQPPSVLERRQDCLNGLDSYLNTSVTSTV